jgi:hypothetical protein
MYQIDNSTAATTLPTPGAVGPNPNSFFTDGNPGSGVAATIVDDDWLNAVQEELCNIVTGAGGTLSKTVRNQVFTAIQSMIAAGTTSIPYDISGGASGALTSYQIVLELIAVRQTTFPASFTASAGYLNTAPTASMTFVVAQNGTSVGTMVFAASSHTATFTAASTVILVAGDRLTVTAPSSVDSTAASLSFTLAGSVA